MMYEFWIINPKTKVVAAKIRTKENHVTFAGAMYTIQNFEDSFLFEYGSWKFKRRVYLFIEGNPFPITLEQKEQYKAPALKRLVQTLALSIVSLKLEYYLKLILIMMIIAIIAIVGVGFFLYNYLEKDLIVKIIQAISETHAIPTK